MADGTVTKQWERISADTISADHVVATLSMRAPMPSGDGNEVTTVNYVALAIAKQPPATTSMQGAMTAEDRRKLDGVAWGANHYVHPASPVAPGMYTQLTVDSTGHVIAGTNPTTLAGYGIVDGQRASRGLSAVAAALDSSTIPGRLMVTGATSGHVDLLQPSTTVTALLNAEDAKKAREVLDIPQFTSMGRALVEAESPVALTTAAGLPTFTDLGRALVEMTSPEDVRSLIGAGSNDLRLDDLLDVEFNEDTEEFSVPALGVYGRVEDADGYVCLGKFFGGLTIYWKNHGEYIKAGLDRSMWTRTTSGRV